MIEVLKAIEHTYNRHSLAIVGVVPHLCQYISYSIISTLRKGKKTLMSDKSNKQTKMDALQALLIAENAISGAITSDRILVTRLALQFCQSRTLKQDEITALLSSIKRLVMISDIGMKIEKSCDTAFLYWHKVILSPYFEHVFEVKANPHRLHYTFYAIQDIFGDIMDLKHLDNCVW